MINYPYLDDYWCGTQKFNVHGGYESQGVETADRQKEAVIAQAALFVYCQRAERTETAQTHERKHHAKYAADDDREQGKENSDNKTLNKQFGIVG